MNVRDPNGESGRLVGAGNRPEATDLDADRSATPGSRPVPAADDGEPVRADSETGDRPPAAGAATPSRQRLSSRIAAFLAARGRERRKLFQELRPLLRAEDLEAIAPALADPSPRLSARITSLLAQHGRLDLLDRYLEGAKPGRAALLRRQYERIADARARGSRDRCE